MNCSNCNNQLADGAQFCSKCGTKQIKEEAVLSVNEPTQKKKSFGLDMSWESNRRTLMGVGFLILLRFLGPLVGSYLVAGIILGILFAVIEYSSNKSLFMENTNKRLVSIGIILLLLIVTGYLIYTNSNVTSTSEVPEYFQDSATWKEFNSVEGNFKVNLPTLPEHQSNTITIPDSNITGTVNLYTAAKDDSSYFIQAILYNDEIDVSAPSAVLEGAFNGRVSEIPNHKIISSNFGTFISNNSLDYLVQSDTYYIYGKLILVGQKLYSLEMACESKKCSTSDYQKFTQSFKLQ